MASRHHNRPALGAIELVIVFAITVILVGITLPVIARMRETANKAACATNLRQVTIACHMYDQQNGHMPPAFGFASLNVDIFSGTGALGTVFFHLLPYIEQDQLFSESLFVDDNTDPPQRYYSYQANGVFTESLAIYSCPSDATMGAGGPDKLTGYGKSSYAANYLVFGITDPDSGQDLGGNGQPSLGTTFTDGTSTTILFGEKYANASITAQDNYFTQMAFEGGTHWAYFQSTCSSPFFAYWSTEAPGTDANSIGPLDDDDPSDSRFQVAPPSTRNNPCLLSTPHKSGMNTAFADGSVRNLSGDIDRFAWWALVTPSGKEGLSADW